MAETRTLDSDDCKHVLQKFLKTDKFQLNSFEMGNYHNPFQGLIGEHFTLRVNYLYEDKERTENFFVKTLSTNPTIIDVSNDLKVYEKESFYYQLLDEYAKYELDISFAPRGLFFKPCIIVLEDLSKNYKGTPKLQLIDLDHSRVCLETLAKFHASSVIYEKYKEKEMGRKFSLNDSNTNVLEDKFGSNRKEGLGSQCIIAAVKGLFDLIDILPENHISHEIFKNTLSEILSIESSNDGLISGIVHSDLWTSNFLYLYQDGKPIEAKLVDFQTIKYGPLELDVVEFLMTSTSRDFREKHFENLVEYYYNKLRKSLNEAGLNSEEILPTKSEFVRSCDNFKLAGKLHAIVDHSYTFLADEIYVDVLESEETFRKFLFEERGKYVIESYNKNEEFKNVLQEDVLELRDLLFS